MRVGLFIYGDLEILTGGFLYDRMMVNHLKSSGDQVEVINISWRMYGRHLTDNASLALKRRLRSAEIDVLIQDELTHPSLFLLNRWLKKRVQYKIVALVHLLRSSEARSTWLNRLYGAVERRYFSTIDGIIFNCDTTRQTVEQLTRRNLPSVIAHPGRDHLHQGFTAEKIVERTSQPGPLRIISIANVLPGKGLHVLIEALIKLPPGSWRLTVAGSLTMDTSYSRAVQEQIARAGFNEHVKLLGTVPNDEMPALLAASQLLVVPSSYEAFAIAYLEAMGFGLPVIASTAGGARELITHGREGFLLAPGDTQSLARHLQQLIQNREQLPRMSLDAYERVNAHPTWAESMGRIRGFLRKLVDD